MQVRLSSKAWPDVSAEGLEKTVATPERSITGATSNPPGILSGLQKEASPCMSRRGYGTKFWSESFPS